MYKQRLSWHCFAPLAIALIWQQLRAVRDSLDKEDSQTLDSLNQSPDSEKDQVTHFEEGDAVEVKDQDELVDENPIAQKFYPPGVSGPSSIKAEGSEGGVVGGVSIGFEQEWASDLLMRSTNGGVADHTVAATVKTPAGVKLFVLSFETQGSEKLKEQGQLEIISPPFFSPEVFELAKAAAQTLNNVFETKYQSGTLSKAASYTGEQLKKDFDAASNGAAIMELQGDRFTYKLEKLVRLPQITASMSLSNVMVFFRRGSPLADKPYLSAMSGVEAIQSEEGAQEYDNFRTVLMKESAIQGDKLYTAVFKNDDPGRPVEQHKLRGLMTLYAQDMLVLSMRFGLKTSNNKCKDPKTQAKCRAVIYLPDLKEDWTKEDRKIKLWKRFDAPYGKDLFGALPKTPLPWLLENSFYEPYKKYIKSKNATLYDNLENIYQNQLKLRGWTKNKLPDYKASLAGDDTYFDSECRIDVGWHIETLTGKIPYSDSANPATDNSFRVKNAWHLTMKDFTPTPIYYIVDEGPRGRVAFEFRQLSDRAIRDDETHKGMDIISDASKEIIDEIVAAEVNTLLLY